MMSTRDPGGPGGFDFELPKFNPQLNLGWFKGREGTLVALVVGVLWLLSGVYQVGPDEMGVVRRFGQFTRVVSSGLNYHIPFPVEAVDTPRVTEIKRVEIGFRTIDPGPPARYASVPTESLMLTGDENIVALEFIVQFKIREAEKYLFNVRNPEGTIRSAAEAAMRSTIGRKAIDAALTTGKFEIQEEMKGLLQGILDRYDAGILVVAIQLQDVQPPNEVIAAFKDVASAREDRNRLINQAEAYANDVIPKSRGEAEQQIRESESYAQERVERSKGDAERFLAVLTEYNKAKVVTKQRLYIETMEAILPDIQKYIIKSGQGSSVLNLLNLDQALGRGGSQQ